MSNTTVTFDIKGADEIYEKCQMLLDKYPTLTQIELEKITNDFGKDVAAKFPHGGTSTKRAVKKSWKKTRIEAFGFNVLTQQIEMQNTAPHFHLVENGHELWVVPGQFITQKSKRSGKASSGKKTHPHAVHKGFVPGKHYCEKTRNEWNNGEFADRVEKHINKVLKKVGLT